MIEFLKLSAGTRVPAPAQVPRSHSGDLHQGGWRAVGAFRAAVGCSLLGCSLKFLQAAKTSLPEIEKKKFLVLGAQFGVWRVEQLDIQRCLELGLPNEFTERCRIMPFFSSDAHQQLQIPVPATKSY